MKPPPLGEVVVCQDKDIALVIVEAGSWREVYTAIQHALQDPSPQLSEAWHDVSSPQTEALRLTDDDADALSPLPSKSWPGAQAVLTWALLRQTNVTILSTSGAEVCFTYGADDDPMRYLAYNGHH
eukprot:5388335-Amphidinium_carterae.2